MFTFETKKDLRDSMRGRTIREIVCKSALTDTHSIELRMTDNSIFKIEATPYGTLRIES